jgi:uridylate kinase
MRVVIRIGGSVIASPFNSVLIRNYSNLFKNLKRKNHQVSVVVGGGSLAREFINNARHLGLDEQAQDEVAISVSRLYAQLLLKTLGILGCQCVPLTVDEAMKCLNDDKIMVMGGLKPGMTTDTVAALLARKVEADLIVKASDQEGIYDKDPRKHSDAIKLDYVDFEKITGVFEQANHQAGIHQILDPEAVKILKEGRMKVVVVNGLRSENVMAAIDGKHVGTVVE